MLSLSDLIKTLFADVNIAMTFAPCISLKVRSNIRSLRSGNAEKTYASTGYAFLKIDAFIMDMAKSMALVVDSSFRIEIMSIYFNINKVVIQLKKIILVKKKKS